jgi:hypothetical protein
MEEKSEGELPSGAGKSYTEIEGRSGRTDVGANIVEELAINCEKPTYPT